MMSVYMLFGSLIKFLRLLLQCIYWTKSIISVCSVKACRRKSISNFREHMLFGTLTRFPKLLTVHVLNIHNQHKFMVIYTCSIKSSSNTEIKGEIYMAIFIR